MPIVKDLLSNNGYTFQDPVTADEMQDLLKPMLHEFKCIIINKDTAKKYGIQPGGKFVTINNKVPDGMFYINAVPIGEVYDKLLIESGLRLGT